MFWFIVLLLLAGAGFYFYQKMMTIEREILAEQAAEQTPEGVVATTEVVRDEATAPSLVTPVVENMTVNVTPVADESLSLTDEVLAAVENLPGLKQTELYSSFTDVSKKQLQQLLKELADNGQLKREKKGSSYLLYPV